MVLTFGIAVSREEPKNVGLNFRQRHGRPARFLPPAGEPRGWLRCEGRVRSPAHPPAEACRISGTLEGRESRNRSCFQHSPHVTTTVSTPGPCTPRTRICSISAVRLGPV